MARTHEQRLLGLLRRKGVARSSELGANGVPRVVLSRLAHQGKIRRVSRGLYSAMNSGTGEHRTIAEAASKVPGGVICLLSALRFHSITTQSPREVWIAIGEKDWKPRIEHPRLRVVRFSGKARSAGVETWPLEGVRVKIYNLPKTIADCFKYRHKIGLDVALEALRESWRAKRVTSDEIWRYAKICRVANVMRPYLESLS